MYITAPVSYDPPSVLKSSHCIAAHEYILENPSNIWQETCESIMSVWKYPPIKFAVK